jgi:hypothetical protein
MNNKNLEENYLIGIFNYCDRWCERCKFTDRCLQRQTETDQRIKHLVNGKNPDDWNCALDDVHNAFKQTLKIIYEECKRQEIDIEKLLKDSQKIELPIEPDKHPLILLSKEYLEKAAEFLKLFGDYIKNEGYDLAERVQILPEAKTEFGTLHQLIDCHETISWYHTMIHVKIYRSLTQKPFEHNKEKLEPKYNDSYNSAKIARVSIMKSLVALHKIYEIEENLQEQTFNLMLILDQLSKKQKFYFKDIDEYKRPYFD